MNLLQAAYCLVVVGGFLVVVVTDPAMAVFAIVGLAAIFGAYVCLEWIFGPRK